MNFDSFVNGITDAHLATSLCFLLACHLHNYIFQNIDIFGNEKWHKNLILLQNVAIPITNCFRLTMVPTQFIVTIWSLGNAAIKYLHCTYIVREWVCVRGVKICIRFAFDKKAGLLLPSAVRAFKFCLYFPAMLTYT